MFEKTTLTVDEPFQTEDGRIFLNTNRHYECVPVGNAHVVMTEIGPFLMWRNGLRNVWMPIDLIYKKLGIKEMLEGD